MVDFGAQGGGGGAGGSRDRWTCPNDRQLALRAKLRTGWSVKTQTMQSFSARNETALDEREREMILDVIKRAETLEASEQQRVGRLVQRLENMKSMALGNGTNKCVLCGDSFGLLGASGTTCQDCKKVACQKCGVGGSMTGLGNSGGKQDAAWLCKICAETREMWKKSGAWFFKGLPKYVLPEPKQQGSNALLGGLHSRFLPPERPHVTTRVSPLAAAVLGRKISSAEEEESSSEDDQLGRNRRILRSSVSQGSNEIHHSPLPQTSQQYRSLDADSDRSSNSGSLKGLLRRDTSMEGGNSERGEFGVRWADCDSVCTADLITGQQQHVLVPSQASTAAGVSRRDSMASSQFGWVEVESRGSFSSQGARSSFSAAGSEAGDVIDEVPEEAYLGSMEYSVTYDAQTSTLHCCLHRAKGLRPMDMNGLCDPYCRAQLLPAAGGKSCAPLRSRTVHKTREPEFNESLAWCHVTETDASRKTLHLVIYDEDRYGDEPLGASRLHLSRLSPGHTSHFNVFLEKPYQDEVAGEEESNPGRGRILISLCYATRRRALLVGVSRCCDLIPMDSNGTSDPFVKLQLRNDPNRRKYKTSIKWRNLNPEFNEEFSIEVKLGELSRRALVITVWDKDLGKANDYLGGLELGYCSKSDRLKHWLDAIKFPDRRHERWHNLTSHPLSD